jgi:hypothetical protein
MTSEDIVLLLRTLWSRATDINCNAKTRLAFHGVLLLAGIGGFRPGVIMQYKYDDVQIGLVRNSLRPDKKKLVAILKIHQNKQISEIVHQDQSDTYIFTAVYLMILTYSYRLTLSITTVPYQLLCLTSILMARVLSKQAFQVNYESLDDILDRPNLGRMDYIPLY